MLDGAMSDRRGRSDDSPQRGGMVQRGGRAIEMNWLVKSLEGQGVGGLIGQGLNIGDVDVSISSCWLSRSSFQGLGGLWR